MPDREEPNSNTYVTRPEFRQFVEQQQQQLETLAENVKGLANDVHQAISAITGVRATEGKVDLRLLATLLAFILPATVMFGGLFVLPNRVRMDDQREKLAGFIELATANEHAAVENSALIRIEAARQDERFKAAKERIAILEMRLQAHAAKGNDHPAGVIAEIDLLRDRLQHAVERVDGRMNNPE